MTKYLETKTNSIEEAIKGVVLGEAMSGEDVAKRMMKIKTMKSFANKVAKMKTVSRDDLEKMLPDYIDGRDITKVIKEKLDPVNKVAVKKKFDDRKDKDIDNDGDVDSTDKYLHKRRKAISKAIKSERVTDVGVDQAKRDLKHAKLKKATDDVKKEEVEIDEEMRVFFVSDKNSEGNVHAKNEKDAIAQAKKKGLKGKISVRDKGPVSMATRGRREDVELGEGYESEVIKVLNKSDIDGYFKMGKLYVNKRDGKDAKKALEDSDEITKLPKMVMEDNKMMKLTKRQRQALSSPAAKGKGKSSVTLPGAEFLSKKKQPMKVGRQSQIVKYEENDMQENPLDRNVQKMKALKIRAKAAKDRGNQGEFLTLKKQIVDLQKDMMREEKLNEMSESAFPGSLEYSRYIDSLKQKLRSAEGNPKDPNFGDEDYTDNMRDRIKKAIERNREAIRVGPKKEAYDIGKDYAEHTLEVTPGQDKKDVDKMLNTAYTKNQGMREALAKVWGVNEGKSPFQKEEEKPLTKTMTGQKPTKVEVEPKMEKK